jgi:hypothetical protein
MFKSGVWPSKMDSISGIRASFGIQISGLTLRFLFSIAAP